MNNHVVAGQPVRFIDFDQDELAELGHGTHKPGRYVRAEDLAEIAQRDNNTYLEWILDIVFLAK